MTKPTLYVAAGPPLTDKGQQPFERRIKKRCAARAVRSRLVSFA